LSSIPSGYTGSNIAKASLKLYVNAVTTAGSFNVDYVNGAWTEGTIDASNAPPPGATIAHQNPQECGSHTSFCDSLRDSIRTVSRFIS